ncbi:MAG: AAA family ATPase [Bacteroidaceae bacterium]|nr:AAA family ATPase [Bacteroidaceae bacterium]
MRNTASRRLDTYNKGKDFVLPEIFKANVKDIGGSQTTYNDYSVIVKTSGGLNIYLPNQWLYIASYFTDFYNELIRYRKVALSVFSPDKLKELKDNELSAEDKESIEKLDLSEQSKTYLIVFITDYSWWSGGKTVDRQDFFNSPILNSSKLVNVSQTYVADLCAFLADKPELVEAIIESAEAAQKENILPQTDFPLQQIYYGAPGTGKSHVVKAMTEGKKVIRTTFHPDSDYSTFVGAYKPTTGLLPICNELGQPIKIGENVLHKEQIAYEFVPQAFLQAYVKAWEFYAEASEDEEPKAQFLVIEEINRGNCAQIFGDLFQLLDRNAAGFSDYPINADKDMEKQLAKMFNGMPPIPMADSINALYGKDVVSDVVSGKILLLPNNLYIWATMNTSDQSLFPIDSAFKRRWDWQYMPISDAKKGWQIEANGKRYDWWQFLQKINDKIEAATYSEDKKLGYFFCKAKDGIIDAETFVGKVLFYLWNDVFKDNSFDDDKTLFTDEDGTPLSYHKFYTVDDNGNAKIAEDKVVLLLKNLGLLPVEESEIEDTEEEEDEDGNTLSSGKRNYDKFSVNGNGSYGKNLLASECMKEYIRLNPEMPVNEVYANWQKLGNIVPHFVETKEVYEARTDINKRTVEIPCGDSVIYVEKNGYGNNGAVEALISAVNKQDWGIILARIEG